LTGLYLVRFTGPACGRILILAAFLGWWYFRGPGLCSCVGRYVDQVGTTELDAPRPSIVGTPRSACHGNLRAEFSMVGAGGLTKSIRVEEYVEGFSTSIMHIDLSRAAGLQQDFKLASANVFQGAMILSSIYIALSAPLYLPDRASYTCSAYFRDLCSPGSSTMESWLA